MANGSGNEAMSPVDPYRNYHFKLEINGMTEGHFSACGGLGVRIQPIQYREGGIGQIVRSLPGPVEYSRVTLKYGLTSSNDLFKWMMTTANGNVERKNISIIQLEQNGADEAMRWNLLRAWPCEWRGSAMDALGSDAAIEELTLAYDSLDKD